MGRPLYRPGMVRAGTNLRGPLEPPPAREGDTFWTVEPDIKLHHFSIGQGRPVLVLHGGPGYPLRLPLSGFDPLTNRFRFHFYDQRGCGHSTRPFDRFASKNLFANMIELERTMGIGAQVADIERIRRLLKQEKLILLGHSFGAFLATMYGAEFPERVEALVLVAPSSVLVLPEEREGFFEQVRRRLPEPSQREFDDFLERYLEFGNLFNQSETELTALNRKVGDYFLMASGDSGITDTIVENGGWMVQAMYLSMGKRHDYRAALRDIPAPALVLHGADDILPEGMSRQYVELLPNARLHVFSSGRTRAAGRAGHFLFTDQPEEFARVLGEFLGQLR